MASLILVGGMMMLRRAPSATSARRFTTTASQQATVTLDDGTRVLLAPNTALTIEENFNHTARLVTLRGEALFDVQTSTREPFVVRAGHSVTRVLGTRFSVRHYDADGSDVQIAVISGKVVIEGSGAPRTLVSGQVGHLTDSTVVVTTVRDMTPYVDWTQGRLVFKDATVASMLSTVGRWYGYEFKLDDSTLARQRVSVVFKTADQTQMIAVLKAMLDVEMTFAGHVITLTSHRERAPTRSGTQDILKPSPEMGR